MILTAADIHARLVTSWPAVLARLGIPEQVLVNRHGPCPACGGRDRFRFDNKHGRGDFFCNRCGAGDGFRLLERAFGWSFSEARARVMAAAGIEPPPAFSCPPLRKPEEPAVAVPSARVLRLLREACPVHRCSEVVAYLEARGLWPLPPGCALKAHPSVEYFHEGQRIGRYAALVSPVVDICGELVTAHVTYLANGAKLTEHEPRKLLGPLMGRQGCAVRLMPAADVVGIAEGVESALSAIRLEGIPCWAALNTSLLAKFEPPPNITRLVLYADRDEAGLTAALRLAERLYGRRMRFHARLPKGKDFNDDLREVRA